jgi:hypothetical protein
LQLQLAIEATQTRMRITLFQPTKATTTMYARRDSSGSSTSASSPHHRPKLLRSSATAPSITPSSSSGGVQASLVSPRSSHKAAATDYLNRMAVFTPASAAAAAGRTEPIMIGARETRGSTSSTSSSSSSVDMHSSSSDSYFSFPSFDNWDPPKDDSEKDSLGT